MNVVRRCKHGLMAYNMKDQWQGRAFEIYGESMESEIGLLATIVSQGMTIVDVGAGIGSHAVPLSRAVGSTGKVFAYEPERRNFYCLCANVSINNLTNIYPYQHALSDKVGVIRVPEIDENTTVNFGGLELHRDYSQSLSYPVAMTTIDKLGLPSCDLIKIDAEGMEKEIVEGARGVIDQFRPFFYIENDCRGQESIQRLLLDLDYEVYLHTAPLFNPDNFYADSKNVFVNDAGAVYISEMLYCVPREKKSPIDVFAWGLKSLRFKHSNCSLAHGGSGTTSLSHPLRIKNGDYEKYLTGNGIDIGGGYATLETPHGTVQPWDVGDGDATFMDKATDEHYDFVYSAHCLEHLADVPTALNNWVRILKSGGILFITVPDWDLYEQKHWPSRYNEDHKATFSTRIVRESVQRDDHFHISQDIAPILDDLGVDILEVRIEDKGYDYRIKDVDQTGPGFNALAQICLIGKKREVTTNSGHNTSPIVK